MRNHPALVSSPRNATELRAVAGVMSRSYKGKPDGFLRYLKKIGPKNVLAARSGGRVAGGLAMLPCGVWFGGRAVPNPGIACIATAPEMRGRGLAPGLMAECVRTMARRGGGRVAIDIRGLAPTYSGMLPPEEVAIAGLLDGPSDDLDLLRTGIAGPVPHTTDGF